MFSRACHQCGRFLAFYVVFFRDYRRKIDSAKRKINNIQNKQKETVKLANMSEKTDEKINDLHLAVSKMRQQQDELHRKLKLEHEKKEKLEVTACGVFAPLRVLIYVCSI